MVSTFTQAIGHNVHIENIYGVNNHHIIESCYKGLAIAMQNALIISPNNKNKIPSTKEK